MTHSKGVSGSTSTSTTRPLTCRAIITSPLLRLLRITCFDGRRTWRPRFYPRVEGSDELTVGERRRGTRAAVCVCAWRPCPLHERLGLVMLGKLRERVISVSFPVLQRRAKLAARHRHAWFRFPRHAERCEMPRRSAGNSARRIIGGLVTRRAHRARYTLVMAAADDAKLVRVAIVVLPRIAGHRVAIDRSWSS